MFAYCENNPSQYMDNGGNRYCEATSVNKESSHNRSISCPNYEKRERKVKIREAKATRDVINTILGLNCFTRTIGYSVSGSALLYGSYSKGIAFDREGNVALIESKMYGGGLVSISGSVFSAYSTAPTLNNLIGPSFQTGVSVDAEVSAGGEISVSQNGYMQYRSISLL